MILLPRNLTPTETRIVTLLLDGHSHTQGEMLDMLWDRESGPDALKQALAELRLKLAPKALDVVSRRGREGTTYRLMRTITSDAE